MNKIPLPLIAHPSGEANSQPDSSVKLDTFGGVLHVEWEPQASVTPLGQLPFFVEFLKTAELFEPWVEECPLEYRSPNAQSKRNVLGTILFSCWRGIGATPTSARYGLWKCRSTAPDSVWNRETEYFKKTIILDPDGTDGIR